MNLWHCPSGKSFMRTVCQVLRTEEKFACVVMPWYHIPDFVQEFIRYSQNYLGYAATSRVEPGIDLTQALERCFSIESTGLDDILSRPALAMYLVLQVSPHLSHAEAAAVPKALEQVAHLAKIHKDDGRPLVWRLLVVLPASYPWPRADVCLEVFYWWGRVCQSDIEYALEQSCAELAPGGFYEWEFFWLYALCQGLTVIDPLISVSLFTDMPTSAAEVYEMLQRHPVVDLDEETRKAVIDMDGQSIHANRALPPDGTLRLLWSRGAVDLAANGLVSIHPAALIAAKRFNSLERLVILGQIKVYLPLVQEVHAFLCSQLRKTCGCDWNKKSPDRYAGLNEEIGSLPRYMQDQLHGRYRPPELLDLAIQWRSIRNCVAHGRMIDCETALVAHKLFCRLRDTL